MTAKEIAERLLAADWKPTVDRVQKAKSLAARHKIAWVDVVNATHALLLERVK